jgi:hypothetical protein
MKERAADCLGLVGRFGNFLAAKCIRLVLKRPAAECASVCVWLWIFICLSLPPWADSCCLIHCRVASAFIYSAFIHTFGTVVIRVPHFLFRTPPGLPDFLFGSSFSGIYFSPLRFRSPWFFVLLALPVRLFFMHGPCFISTCLGRKPVPSSDRPTER